LSYRSIRGAGWKRSRTCWAECHGRRMK
jgi:hypothetical protein